MERLCSGSKGHRRGDAWWCWLHLDILLGVYVIVIFVVLGNIELWVGPHCPCREDEVEEVECTAYDVRKHSRFCPSWGHSQHKNSHGKGTLRHHAVAPDLILRPNVTAVTDVPSNRAWMFGVEIIWPH